MRDRDLRANLAQVGQQKPGLELAGELLDGRRRAAICAELGVSFDVRSVDTLEEACSLLWIEHPSRALELARSHGVASLLELARLCATTTTAIAKELAARPKGPPKAHGRANDRVHAKKRLARSAKREAKMVRRCFVLEPELYAYAREAAIQKGHNNVSIVVRQALWREVALTVPNAPQFQPRRVQPANGARDMRKRRAG